MSKLSLVILLIIVGLGALQFERIWQDTEPLRQPYYRWAAKSGVADLAEMLEREVARGGTVPTRLSFTEYLQKNGTQPERINDPWGTPYYLKAELGALWVGSAGRDGKVGTEDDILSSRVATGLVRQSEAAR